MHGWPSWSKAPDLRSGLVRGVGSNPTPCNLFFYYIKIYMNFNMPEGPEATHLSRKMNTELVGKKLESIDILSGRYKKHGPPVNYKNFIYELPLKLEKVYNKGKVIIFQYEKGWNIISKLGLMGWWYTKDKPTWRKEHKNLLFHFSNNITATYSDTLSYGTLSFVNDNKILEKELNKLGLDIIDKNTTFDLFWTKFEQLSDANKNNLIEDVLIDQHILISGVGNYLKSESLYDAKISPLRKMKDISKLEYKRLFESIKKISKRFLYTLEHNEEAYLSQFRIYMKKVDHLGNKVLIHKSKTGRSTFWVPELQK